MLLLSGKTLMLSACLSSLNCSFLSALMLHSLALFQCYLPKNSVLQKSWKEWFHYFTFRSRKDIWASSDRWWKPRGVVESSNTWRTWDFTHPKVKKALTQKLTFQFTHKHMRSSEEEKGLHWRCSRVVSTFRLQVIAASAQVQCWNRGFQQKKKTETKRLIHSPLASLEFVFLNFFLCLICAYVSLDMTVLWWLACTICCITTVPLSPPDFYFHSFLHVPLCLIIPIYFCLCLTHCYSFIQFLLFYFIIRHSGSTIHQLLKCEMCFQSLSACNISKMIQMQFMMICLFEREQVCVVLKFQLV